jgi:hypothetical protein
LKTKNEHINGRKEIEEMFGNPANDDGTLASCSGDDAKTNSYRLRQAFGKKV